MTLETLQTINENDVKTKIQKDKKTKRQKDKKTKKNKKGKNTKKIKRQRPNREFNIATSGQFCTLAMF